MKTIEMIGFLSSLKYNERALTDTRKEHDRKLDEICLFLNDTIPKKPRGRIDDTDCPNGVCPTR